MPYNTRRKSVSLTLLGIHIPNSSRSSSQRSPPATTTASTTTTTSTSPSSDDQHPAKRIKRSSISASNASPLSKTPTKSAPSVFAKPERPSTIGGRMAETTPPPSPGDAESSFKVDTQGINDEIVVGVIELLQKTGNRPHLLKELAAILQHSISIVETSANQPAIISSRLTNYMKRPWTALSPCPLGKELVGTHPKRIYFFLNTMPRQAFPDPPESLSPQQHQPRIISPSLTSNENESDDVCDRRRSELSPSPELDLSGPGLDDEDEEMGGFLSASDSFAGLQLQHSHTSSTSSLSQEQNSPPLEELEREFTQCANALHQRRQSEIIESAEASAPAVAAPEAEVETDASIALLPTDDHYQADADALFGPAVSQLTVPTNFLDSSSPMLQPQKAPTFSLAAVRLPLPSSYPTSNKRSWTETLDSSGIETVELDELDELFACY